MAEDKKWWNESWNPVTGCTKGSPGCKNCYAERDWARMVHLPAYAGRDFTDVGCHPERLDQPLRWARPRKIFVNSMSDLFHEAVPDAFLDKVFAVMAHAKQHIFQVLTKRHNRMHQYLTTHNRSSYWAQAANDMGLRPDPKDKNSRYTTEHFPGRDVAGCYQADPLPNVWLGVSAENQTFADARVPVLLATPAAVRWVSLGPLLGAVSLAEHGLHGDPGQLDWVVLEGESGSRARPMHPDWVRGMAKECAAAGVPFNFKQWGEYAPATYAPVADQPNQTSWRSDDPAVMKVKWLDPHEWGDGIGSVRVGTRHAGRLLDGVLYDEYPQAA